MILALSGGMSGIGAAIADEAIARKWSVLRGSRRTGLDVRDELSIEAFLGPLVDGAIACAGISLDSLFVTMPVQDVDAVLDTNLNGAFLFARAAIRRGATSVLLVGSLSQLGAPSNAVYAASKAALVGLARALHEEYPMVRTNVLVPGFVLTPMSESLSESMQGRLRSQAPIGRAVMLSEFANAAIDLLLSPARGCVVRATGGLLETPL